MLRAKKAKVFAAAGLAIFIGLGAGSGRAEPSVSDWHEVQAPVFQPKFSYPVKANQAFAAGVYGVVVPSPDPSSGRIAVMLLNGKTLQYSKVTQPMAKPFDVVTPDVLLGIAGEEGSMHLQVLDEAGNFIAPVPSIKAAMEPPIDPNLLTTLRNQLLDKFSIAASDASSDPVTAVEPAPDDAATTNISEPGFEDHGISTAELSADSSTFDGHGDMIGEASDNGHDDSSFVPIDGNSGSDAGDAGPSSPAGDAGFGGDSGGDSGADSGIGSGGGSGIGGASPSATAASQPPVSGNGLSFASPLNTGLIQPFPTYFGPSLVTGSPAVNSLAQPSITLRNALDSAGNSDDDVDGSPHEKSSYGDPRGSDSSSSWPAYRASRGDSS